MAAEAVGLEAEAVCKHTASTSLVLTLSEKNCFKSFIFKISRPKKIQAYSENFGKLKLSDFCLVGRMVLTASTVQGSDLTVTMTESVQGKPKLDTFTFKVNNFVSPPLHVDPTELEVSDAVKSLFGPTCPSGLGNVAPGIAY